MNKYNLIKDKIIDLLDNELDGVYCNTCAHKDADSDEYGIYDFHPCYNCHRKNINWQISFEYVEQLANRILKEVERIEK